MSSPFQVPSGACTFQTAENGLFTRLFKNKHFLKHAHFSWSSFISMFHEGQKSTGHLVSHSLHPAHSQHKDTFVAFL